MSGLTPPPPGAGTPPAAPPKKPRNRRLRLWLALGAGIVSLLCLGGIGIAVLVYDDETKIERAEPDAVVDNFLRSYLGNRNDDEAALNTCKAGAQLTELQALRSEMVEREKNFDVAVSATWGTLTVINGDAKQSNVDADLTIASFKNNDPVSRRTETWTFGLVDEDGWRVCSATKTA